MPSIAPLWYQLPSWKAFDLGKRRHIRSLPRRHGKDFIDLSITAREAVLNRGTYYYVFPTRRWGERAVWETMATIGGKTKPIIEWIFPPEFCKCFVSDLRVEIRGRNGVSKFFMGGTDNLDFVGQGGQGYVMSEFSLHKEEVTGLLAPIIRQSQAFLLLNGTMRGKNNPLYKILKNTQNDPEWFSTWLMPEQTKLYCWINEEEGICINPELKPLIGTVDNKTGKLYVNCQGVPYYDIQSDIDSGLISFALARQEYLNRADSEVDGGYYGYELKKVRASGRIKPIDPFSDVVFTFWDLGGVKQDSDSTAITFAHYNEHSDEVKVVDYYENSGHLRGHYFDVIKQKGYTYGGHFMPHDGKRTNEWTGETSMDTAFYEHGVEVRAIPKSNNLMNDIEITRRGFAKTVFSDSPTVDKLITHLNCYHENHGTGRPCHKNNCQECNGASHGADSFRGLQIARHLKMIRPYLVRTDNKHNDWRTKRTEDDEYFIA